MKRTDVNEAIHTLCLRAPQTSREFAALSIVRQHIDELETLVESACEILAEYLPPDSGITEHEVVNQLLGVFDGPEYRAAFPKIRTITTEEQKADELAREADRQYSEGKR